MQERTGKAVPVRREGGAVLDEIVDNPRAAELVPRLPAGTLYGVIERHGLEACGALLALASPAQIAQVLDLDLWRRPDAGRSDVFDAERFGVWLEVLVEEDADRAAAIVARLDVDLAAAGLAQHVRVFDIATLEAYETTDGTDIPAVIEPDGGLACDLAGRRLIARRPDAWDAITAMLAALHASHFDAFVHLMGACNALSHSRPEVDGLDALLGRGAQSLFDLGEARAQRREALGFASPAEARAFLETARRVSLAAANPPRTAARTPPGRVASPSSRVEPDAAAASEAVVVASAADESGPRFDRLQRAMRAVAARDPLLHAARQEDALALANALVAGCRVDGRAFTPREASDAVAATCNLGLECWPAAWRRGADEDDLLVHHDLRAAFGVGWTVLYDDVCAPAAGALVAAIDAQPPRDRQTRLELAGLRATVLRHARAGTPWEARDALDIVAGLDQLVWITLLGLIAECPVLPATLALAPGRRRAIDPSAWAFIAERRQITAIQAFLATLPDLLNG